jgi:acyl carrier protein
MIAQADVAQRDQVDRELARAATLLPPIAGVIHSAGLLNDGVLDKMDWPRFSEVLAPKVRGSWNLYEALGAKKLDFFVCFSSIAGLFGSPGQANHAAANAFLDTFASFLKAVGIPAKSINWGAWAEVGAAAERNVGERVGERGVETITPALGLDALERVMRRPAVQIAVTPMRWEKFLEPFASGSEPPFFSGVAPQGKRVSSVTAQPAVKKKHGMRDRLAHAPSAKRPSVLATYVSEEVARVLGIGSAEKVDQRQPLVDMGLDSLMAVELRNLLGSGLELQRSLPATIVYDYPSVKEMAAYLETLLPFNSSVIEEPVQRVAPENIGDTGALADIEQLSDEEVDRLFAERVAALEKS